MGEYGALVKSAREQRGMTQDEVARKMGRPHTFLVRIEKGSNSNPPDPETMRAIWRTLGLSMRSQLTAIGYLDEDEPEPGVAYVIRDDDPRKTMVRVLDGVSPSLVESITGMVSLMIQSIRREQGQDVSEGDHGVA